jgi:hypothetical protein
MSMANHKVINAWKDGKKEGQCIYRWANGDVYEGTFKDDEMGGHGVMRAFEDINVHDLTYRPVS